VIIQARNTHGFNRESGADKFIVKIIRPDKVPKEEEVVEVPEEEKEKDKKEKKN
jgi:hypothetical protein